LPISRRTIALSMQSAAASASSAKLRRTSRMRSPPRTRRSLGMRCVGCGASWSTSIFGSHERNPLEDGPRGPSNHRRASAQTSREGVADSSVRVRLATACGAGPASRHLHRCQQFSRGGTTALTTVEVWLGLVGAVERKQGRSAVRRRDGEVGRAPRDHDGQGVGGRAAGVRSGKLDGARAAKEYSRGWADDEAGRGHHGRRDGRDKHLLAAATADHLLVLRAGGGGFERERERAWLGEGRTATRWRAPPAKGC
jgi:hypothetical protein